MSTLKKFTHNLNCPLCMDTFEEPTLLNCGHTFCRKCLLKYDEVHSDSSAMRCPLCRETTPLTDKRVRGLSANVSLNGLVGDINRISVSLTDKTAEELRPRCSLCRHGNSDAGNGKTSRPTSIRRSTLPSTTRPDSVVEKQPLAVSFCYDCDGYMCESCFEGHCRMVQVFGGHRTVSVKDILGRTKSTDSSVSSLTTCADHHYEQADHYCQDCEELVCHKCTVSRHRGRDHSVKGLTQYENETRQKIDLLVMRSSVRRAKIEKHIADIELEEKHIQDMVARMEIDIQRAYEEKQRRLDEYRAHLLEETKCIESVYHDKLVKMSKNAHILSKQISISSEMVAKGRRKLLRGESRIAHRNLAEELDSVLNREVDMMAPGRLSDVTGKTCFVPASSDALDLGEIGAQITGWTVVNEIELPGEEDSMNGIARMEYDKVAVAYYNGGVDWFDIHTGSRRALVESDDRGTHDIAFLSDGRFVVTNTRRVMRLFNTDRTPTDVNFETPRESSGITMLDVDPHDQIFLSFWDLKKIFVFSPDGGAPLRVINTEKVPRQVKTTASGIITTQRLSNVTILDSDGTPQWSVTRRKGFLHPAINDQDQLYIASVKPHEGSLSIEHYSFGGKHVGTVLKNYKIRIPTRNWYYMTFLSPSCIAFCTANRLYVIGKSLTRTKTLSEVVSPARHDDDIGADVKVFKSF